MPTISVKHLGLAAFIKLQGAPLVSVEARHFIFETPLTLGEWRVLYSNSCCMRHDTLVCELRRHLAT